MVASRCYPILSYLYVEAIGFDSNQTQPLTQCFWCSKKSVLCTTAYFCVFCFTCSGSVPTKPLHTACSSTQDSHVHLHPDGSAVGAVYLWIQPHPLHEDDLSCAAHVLDTHQVSVSSTVFSNTALSLA